MTMRVLRNCWYVAAADEEVGEAPMRRTICGEPVMFYRDDTGSLVGLHDRCPHRFVPLSMGRRVEGGIECIYHGLRFGHDGACILNPHDDSIPGRLRVRSYPLAERYGHVWIWMGEPEKADPALIPDFGFLEDGATFVAVRGRLTVAANYQLVVDNLLDLSHVEFLHPSFRTDEGVAGHRIEYFEENGTIVSNRWKPGITPNQFARLLWADAPERGDARANMRWFAPGLLYFDLGTTHVGGTHDEGLCTPAAHFLTPETEFSTHYFWAQARNRRLDDTALSAQVHAMASRIFDEEDRMVIEAQQREMGQSSDLLAFKPLLLKSDAPAMLARRQLGRMIDAEQESPA